MIKMLCLFIFSFWCISCSTQLKLNKSTDIDIVLEKQPQEKENGKSFSYLLKNNTNNTYIIDPMGFEGSITYYENNNPAPLMSYPEGYFYRGNEIQCKKDIIILKPFESKKAAINICINSTGSGLDVYRISPHNRYFYSVKSVHNEKTLKINGCEKYINHLENQGYKILEDSIIAKIPFIPDFRWSKNR